MPIAAAKNVLGGDLIPCSYRPLTGFFRDGCCNTSAEDYGCHTVCCVLTGPFLEFSVARGNDLVTPRPEYHFPGLKPGDKWCVCAGRWVEALQAGVACPVVLEATHEKMLEWVGLELLQEYAYHGPEPDLSAGWPPEPSNN